MIRDKYKAELLSISNEMKIRYSIELLEEENDTNDRILRIKIKNYIIGLKKNIELNLEDKSALIESALLLLAKHTGTLEEEIVGEQILDELESNNIISKPQRQLYYDNWNMGRWY